MRMNVILAAAIAAALPALAACNQKGKETKKPDSGAKETTDAAEEAAPEPAKKAGTWLSQVQAKAIDPADNDEAAGALEETAAVKGVGDFADCEKKRGEAGPFEGTVVIELKLEGKGKLAGDPAPVLTTATEKGDFERCLADAVKKLDLSAVGLESAATFHLILKFAKP